MRVGKLALPLVMSPSFGGLRTVTAKGRTFWAPPAGVAEKDTLGGDALRVVPETSCIGSTTIGRLFTHHRLIGAWQIR